MKTRALILLAVVGAAFAACGPEELDTGSSFIALERDFADYRSWTSYDLGPDGGIIDTAHTSNPRVVYINRLPDAGATEFPQGTVVVKESPLNTFAMAKRGGGYNASGAHGWEWFELLRDETSGQVSIVWRGLGPPAGEVYGKAGQTCNMCHAANVMNDSVLSLPLQVLNQP